VELHMRSVVTHVDADGLEARGPDGATTRYEAATVLWAAGIAAPPLADALARACEAEQDRAGRIVVTPELTVPGHPEISVVGDMMSLDHLPGVAQVAIQGARYAAKEISNRLDGGAPQAPFRYFDKGSMATISRFRAVAMIGKLRLTGFVAWLLWLGVHLVYITGFKNRITALLHWAVSFVGRGRSERTATEQQIFARAALERVEGGASGLVRDPAERDADRARKEAAQRAELEARAREEARLTDAGERGVRSEDAV
jgi:NADH:ubiquinone reductase (H+-translocating)